MKRVVFLNGCPGSGKDTIANRLTSHHGFHHLKFAQPLRDAACAVFGIRDREIDEWKRKKIGEKHTGRDFMIGLAETLIKPSAGLDWFGVRSAETMLKLPDTRFVISDSGFDYEVMACVNRLKQDLRFKWSFEVWLVERDGTSFDGDSRHSIAVDLPTFPIENNGNLDSLHNTIDNLIKRGG